MAFDRPKRGRSVGNSRSRSHGGDHGTVASSDSNGSETTNNVMEVAQVNANLALIMKKLDETTYVMKLNHAQVGYDMAQMGNSAASMKTEFDEQLAAVKKWCESRFVQIT